MLHLLASVHHLVVVLVGHLVALSGAERTLMLCSQKVYTANVNIRSTSISMQILTILQHAAFTTLVHVHSL
jgi:hypothetical protein